MATARLDPVIATIPRSREYFGGLVFLRELLAE
jgi:hypothetical protein